VPDTVPRRDCAYSTRAGSSRPRSSFGGPRTGHSGSLGRASTRSQARASLKCSRESRRSLARVSARRCPPRPDLDFQHDETGCPRLKSVVPLRAVSLSRASSPRCLPRARLLVHRGLPTRSAAAANPIHAIAELARYRRISLCRGDPVRSTTPRHDANRPATVIPKTVVPPHRPGTSDGRQRHPALHSPPRRGRLGVPRDPTSKVGPRPLRVGNAESAAPPYLDWANNRYELRCGQQVSISRPAVLDRRRSCSTAAVRAPTRTATGYWIGPTRGRSSFDSAGDARRVNGSLPGPGVEFSRTRRTGHVRPCCDGCTAPRRGVRRLPR